MRWRPKSSMTSVPQLLFNCRGDSQTLVDLFKRTSSSSIVNFTAGNHGRAANVNPASVDGGGVHQTLLVLIGDF